MGTAKTAGVVKIAIMLPFFADNEPDIAGLEQIPERAKAALEFYEGFETSVLAFGDSLSKQYHVKVLDTQRDTIVTKMQLRDLERFKPDVVVGEIYNRQSRLIADWADRNGVVHLVPLSPTYELTQGRLHTYLLTASTYTHGRSMAEYAFRDLGLRNVIVWAEANGEGNDLSKAFENQFRIMGGVTNTVYLDADFKTAQSQIYQQKTQMANYQGTYIALFNEEIAGLLFSTIDFNGWKLKVMTTPEIENFDKIDSETKDRLKVYYTSSFVADEEGESYQFFLQNHLLNLQAPPSIYHIQGFDLGLYLFNLMENYTGSQPLEYHLRDFRPIEVLHGSVFFDRETDNQFIKILQMTNKGIIELR